MSTNSINYNLQKDEQTDYYDIDKVNSNLDIIDTALKGLEDTKAVKGTAYVKGENNIKVVQGVPVGGQFEQLAVAAGYLKIKIPTKDHTTPFEFDVSIRHVGTESLTAKYRVKGHLPSGDITSSYQGVTVIKGSVSDLVVDFCKGATEDYLIFRLAAGTKDFGYSSIVIDNIHYRGSISDWSTGWGISIITILETLGSNKITTVTPFLNATHLGGYGYSLIGEPNKITVLDEKGSVATSLYSHDGYIKNYTAKYVGQTVDAKTFLVLLTPAWLSGLVNASLVKGKFFFSRGSNTHSNITSTFEIDLKTAYNSNIIKSIDGEFNFGTVNYNGVLYYCIYGTSTYSSMYINFEGMFKTIDSTITFPTIISDYSNNALISNLTQIDNSKNIANGFIKRIVSGVSSLLSTISLFIKKTSTQAFRVAKDDDTEVFNVDTTNSLLTGLAADKKQDKLKLENSLKVVHGIPIGGQKYFGTSNQTGAIKIKLPNAKTNTRYSFKVKLRNYTTNSNKVFFITGINYDQGVGALAEISNMCKVTEISDNINFESKTVKFYTGASDDYILIGGISDVWDYLSVTVSEIEYYGTGVSVDWSTGWEISIITALENLTSAYYVDVTTSLNATHLGGVHASSKLNISDLLTQIKLVDGAGSGLDADLLDNKEATYFRREFTARIQPSLWSRILYAQSTQLVGSFILSVSHTRYNVVVGSVFLVYFSSGGKAKITQLSHSEYSNISIRLVYEGTTSSNIYVEIKDTNVNNDALTYYNYQINLDKIISSSITEYTEFTNGEASTKIGDSFTTVANKMLISGKEVAYTDSPVFINIPTTPTAAAGATGQQLANLDFVNAMLGGNTVPAKSLGTSGYEKMANGKIMQWGVATTATVDGSYVDLTFPIAFPNNIFSMVSTSANGTVIDGVPTFSLTGARIQSYNRSTGGTVSATHRWIAIGN